MHFTIGGESGRQNKRLGTIQDGFLGTRTVLSMQHQHNKAVLGMLEAAGSSQDGAIELSNALHPQLWSWVANGGEDDNWTEAVAVLRTGVSRSLGGSLSDDLSASLGGMSGVRSDVREDAGFGVDDYSWVRRLSGDEQMEAYAHVMSEGGIDSSEELRQLVADALDGELVGVLPRQAASYVASSMTSQFYWEILKLRKNLIIDDYAVEMLLKASELRTANEMLEDVRDGRCSVSAYSRQVLSMDSNWRVYWPLLAACGERIQWSWTAEWSWREFAQAVILTPDQGSATALADTWRSSKQSVYRHKQHAQAYDEKLVSEAMSRAFVLEQPELRERLVANIEARLLGWWLTQPAPVGPVDDTEARKVLESCADGAIVAKAVDCLGVFPMPYARFLLETSPGLARTVLGSGNVRAGACLYRLISPQLTKSSSWRLFLQLADSFNGTASELVECVTLLDA